MRAATYICATLGLVSFAVIGVAGRVDDGLIYDAKSAEAATEFGSDLADMAKAIASAKAPNVDYRDSVVFVKIKTGGHGTGFFIAPGLIVTNRHVVENSNGGINFMSVALRQVNEGTYDTMGREYGVLNVIRPADKNLDLALIQTDLSGTALPLNCNGLNYDDQITIVGHPIGARWVKQHGRVSSSTPIMSGNHNFVSFDIGIDRGNSGGPVINNSGEVIGVVTATMLVELGRTPFGTINGMSSTSLAISSIDLCRFVKFAFPMP